MSLPLLILTPCGGAKRAAPSPAADLYTGLYTRECLAAARQLAAAAGADDTAIRILSAGHGFVPLDRELAPYEATFGGPGARTLPALRTQAAAEGLLEVPRVLALGGSRYVAMARALWPHAYAPLGALPAGQRGIGHQRGWLARLRDGRVPVAAVLARA